MAKRKEWDWLNEKYPPEDRSAVSELLEIIFISAIIGLIIRYFFGPWPWIT